MNNTVEEPVVGYIQCKCGEEVEYDYNDEAWELVICPSCGRRGCFTRAESEEADG